MPMKPKLKLVIAIFVAIGLTLPVNARTITNDNGGRISKFQHHFRIAIKANVRYRIKGTCLSVCTIYLGLPYVCVYPDAILGFHGAWPSLMDPSQQRIADKKMGRYLPSNLRRHYMDEGDTKTRCLSNT